MLKKTITYTDYNGNERTEDFYFNLTQAEVVEMDLMIKGGMVAFINKIVSEQSGPEIMKTFKEFLRMSYGEKSLDGREFIKVDENGHRLFDKFVQTEAYSEIFMDLMSDAQKAADFINGIIPNADKSNAAPQVTPLSQS